MMRTMSDTEQLTVTLPRALADQLRQSVANGDYLSISDAVAAALVLWDADHGFAEPDLETMRRLVDEGLKSGEPIEAEEVFADLRSRIKAMHAAD
jgi:antitoxin ParD1/3/4